MVAVVLSSARGLSDDLSRSEAGLVAVHDLVPLGEALYEVLPQRLRAPQLAWIRLKRGG